MSSWNDAKKKKNPAGVAGNFLKCLFQTLLPNNELEAMLKIDVPLAYVMELS